MAKKTRGSTKQPSRPMTPLELKISNYQDSFIIQSASPPSPSSSTSTGPGSPNLSMCKDTDAETDARTTPSSTPTRPFDLLKLDLPESSSTSTPASISITAPVASNMALEAETSSGESDVHAIGQLQESMKIALQGLASAFQHIDKSTRLMTQLAQDIQEREQLNRLRDDLEHQIKSQREELDDLKSTLQTRIQQTAAHTIKTQLNDMIQKSVESVIEERVREELSIQIPSQVRQRAADHQRQMLQAQTDLHNSEARRYNASLQSVTLSVPLRPLLRPVPTPEQSPYPILTTPAGMDSTTEVKSGLPVFTYSTSPSPAPMKRSTSNAPSAMSRSHSLQPTSSASDLFPRDLKSLFSLNSSSTRTLLKEYGLQSTAPSPQTDSVPDPLAETKSKQPASSGVAPLLVVEEFEESTEQEMKAHVEDMNTFMSHIGVPFLMVPPPRTKETNADTRRRKLAPLIINKTGFR